MVQNQWFWIGVTLYFLSKMARNQSFRTMVTLYFFFKKGSKSVIWDRGNTILLGIFVWPPPWKWRFLARGFLFDPPPENEDFWIGDFCLTPLRPSVGGGLGVFAFHDVPSRRFAPGFVCFEAPVCIQWLSDPFSAWGASVSDVGKVVPRNLPRR